MVLQPSGGVGPRQGAMSLVFRIRAQHELLTRCPALRDFAAVDGSVVVILKVCVSVIGVGWPAMHILLDFCVHFSA